MANGRGVTGGLVGGRGDDETSVALGPRPGSPKRSIPSPTPT